MSRTVEYVTMVHNQLVTVVGEFEEGELVSFSAYDYDTDEAFHISSELTLTRIEEELYNTYKYLDMGEE